MCGLLTQSRRLEDLCVLARPVPAKFRSTCSPVPTGSARVPTGSKRVSLGCHGILCSILWLKQIYPWLFGWWDVLAPEQARIALLSDQNLESSVFQRFCTATTQPSLHNSNQDLLEQQQQPARLTKNNYYPNRLNQQQQQQPWTHSTPATQTKHNNNPNRLKHDSNAQTTAPTSLPHHNTSPPVTTTRTTWNVNSNNPNLLGQHKQPIVVVKCAVQRKPWMTDNQENLNEDSFVLRRTWMETMCNINHLSHQFTTRMMEGERQWLWQSHMHVLLMGQVAGKAKGFLQSHPTILLQILLERQHTSPPSKTWTQLP